MKNSSTTLSLRLKKTKKKRPSYLLGRFIFDLVINQAGKALCTFSSISKHLA